MSELLVFFEDFSKGLEPDRDHPELGHPQLNFMVQPPINVHDKRMVDKVAQANASSLRRGFTLNSPAEEIIFTHSDAEATYGSYVTGKWRLNGVDPEATDELKEFLCEKFESALNPMGHVVVKFVFGGEEAVEGH